MKNEAVFLYAESGTSDSWEQEEKSSYDAELLATQYQERLFSEAGRALLDTVHDEPAPVLCARGL